jgi:hypothetical protein
MNLTCNLCNRPFKEDDEVMYVAYAYWRELPSRVSFSTTKPHDIDQDSVSHVACKESYLV